MTPDTPGQPFQPTWDSLANYQIPEWYQDAKFGIFIHWGVYSVPAFGSEWYPRNMYQEGSREFAHHVATYGPHSEFGYKDFIPQFRAERFDPAEWAELFREAGAKFVVPVAEHHDGFAMYETELNLWNAKNMGPGRDVIGELAGAVRARDMVFGLSTHRAEHWFFMDGGRRFDSDVQDPAFEDFYGPAQPALKDWHDRSAPGPDEKFLDDWLARTCELVDKYQPQIVWFDWWIDNYAFAPYLPRFAAYYYNRGAEWGRGVAINYKYEAFPKGTAVFDVERGGLEEIRDEFWQTDTSVARNSWSYVPNNDYKTAESIVHDLIDIVSKNGALLLNIGPKSDGTIPEVEQQMLRDIGGWLKINGEAIYGTRPWHVFGEGPTKVIGGAFKDTERAPFTAQDFRFTTKGDALFAVGLAWPDDGVARIGQIGVEQFRVRKVELLGHAGPIRFEQSSEGLTVHLPNAAPTSFAYSLRLT